LGLALAQRTAEEHGGRLTLADDEVMVERGAVFALELPSASDAASRGGG
jgi:signal transduction histidine kinase